ncbi:hypothetical protein [Methylococcus sp. EFPC2]|uniref:hypothetical protein n=1 Tax=Methylococcus sp. EFPC2 TaxID=2812648 RepID=UPI0019686526|nr:hypothetical protein [Methylococcus sp. EFPC2]QSA98486.1 hypothetical protein JWZ97_06685 [Methylococcus sp. EFPC2]
MKLAVQIACGIVIAAVTIGLSNTLTNLGTSSAFDWLHTKNQQKIEEERRKTMIAAEEQRRINEKIARERAEENARKQAELARLAQEKEQAWTKYFIPSARCKRAKTENVAWSRFMECHNEESQQRREFEAAYKGDAKTFEETVLKRRIQQRNPAKDEAADQCEHWKELWQTTGATERTDIVAENMGASEFLCVRRE